MLVKNFYYFALVVVILFEYFNTHLFEYCVFNNHIVATYKCNNLHINDHSDIDEQDIFISGPQTIIENGIYICSEVDIYDMAMASS